MPQPDSVLLLRPIFILVIILVIIYNSGAQCHLYLFGVMPPTSLFFCFFVIFSYRKFFNFNSHSLLGFNRHNRVPHICAPPPIN